MKEIRVEFPGEATWPWFCEVFAGANFPENTEIRFIQNVGVCNEDELREAGECLARALYLLGIDFGTGT